MAEIYLAGGCFWGAEKYLAAIRGVLNTQVGYANGTTENPSYEDVCRRGTGHAETVRVVYDKAVLPLKFLLSLYYEAVDHTSLNRQGNDRGVQYRTGIYYTDADDRPVIDASIAGLREKLAKPVAIEVGPLKNFSPAEEYHQKYLDKNPGGYCHIGGDKFKKAAAAVVDPSAYSPPDKAALRASLTPAQYAVTQEAATEPPFSNEFWNHYQARYLCGHHHRRTALLVRGQVRVRLWLAQFFKAPGPGRRAREKGRLPRQNPHRGPQPPGGRAPGPCLQRRAAGQGRSPVLYQQRRPPLYPKGGYGPRGLRVSDRSRRITKTDTMQNPMPGYRLTWGFAFETGARRVNYGICI